MQPVTNISITETARKVLDRRKASFKTGPRSVLAICYESSFTNSDGTTVAGFVPGYTIVSWPLDYLGPGWLLIRLVHGAEFYLMPRFRWDTNERYVMDLLSLQHEIFSIVPVAR